jgi:hypothetical protein
MKKWLFKTLRAEANNEMLHFLENTNCHGQEEFFTTETWKDYTSNIICLLD